MSSSPWSTPSVLADEAVAAVEPHVADTEPLKRRAEHRQQPADVVEVDVGAHDDVEVALVHRLCLKAPGEPGPGAAAVDQRAVRRYPRPRRG